MLLKQLDIPTVLGNLVAISSKEGLIALDFKKALSHYLSSYLDKFFPRHQWTTGSCAFLETTHQWIVEYFKGNSTKWKTPLPKMDLQGTPFCKKVWQTLIFTPFGTTESYGQLASKLNSPSAARAVGRAVSLNPIMIMIPCHRIIGSNGALVGFRGGPSA